ncbi:succinyl coenzyme A ligase (ADP forming) subunit beta [Trichuris trichiura]|uniref:Succinate--CoA ligase [ADP-forming] subunit beta, mitochondrial n=1 Tax=Trichuris trichiura TaxID=36087 RepID=A0A077ZD47_TRITR|nr:succinyl coenzyme A ligase (ADP forming) subunit beta [Trichuris trichiura]
MAHLCRTNILANTCKALHKSFVRHLTCLEHQALKLLEGSQIPVPRHFVVSESDRLEEALQQIGGDDFVLKALVPTGGRGLGVFENGLKGGVQLVCSHEEAHKLAKRMLGYKLVTKQTGAKGILCEKLLVAQRHFLRREYYFSITLDRTFNGPVVIGCAQGGVSIEQIAKEDPDAIVYAPVDVNEGLTEELASDVASKIGIHGSSRDEAVKLFIKLYNIFIKNDCNLLEINPVAEDSLGHSNTLFEIVLCMDCKMSIDDAASYRQKELFDYIKPVDMTEQEKEAKKFDLNYIPLTGNIGCMVNGAGLAMATMDIIKLHGGTPANFLDVGGGAHIEQVKAAFRIIMEDPNVRAVLVNIFGGILRCDVIATGVCHAAQELNITVPIVCRLQGTKVDDAKALIASSDLKVLAVDNLDDAAKMVASAVRLASIVDMAREVALDVSFELPI